MPSGAGASRQKAFQAYSSAGLRKELPGKPSLLHGPRGGALALERLIVEILMEVEQADDAVRGQRGHGLRDQVEVVVVVAERLWLPGGPDDTHPHRVEAVGL